jgi:hypothetical protein
MAVLQATTLPLEVKVKIPTQPKEGWMGNSLHPMFICLAEFLPGPPARVQSRFRSLTRAKLCVSLGLKLFFSNDRVSAQCLLMVEDLGFRRKLVLLSSIIPRHGNAGNFRGYLSCAGCQMCRISTASSFAR